MQPIVLIREIVLRKQSVTHSAMQTCEIWWESSNQAVTNENRGGALSVRHPGYTNRLSGFISFGFGI